LVSFWDDLVPSALLSLTIFAFGESLILSRLGYIPWLFTNDAAVFQSALFLVSCIIGGIYFGTEIKESKVYCGVKLGVLVSSVNLVSFNAIMIFVSLMGGIFSYDLLRIINALGLVSAVIFLFSMIGSIFGTAIGRYLSKIRIIKEKEAK